MKKIMSLFTVLLFMGILTAGALATLIIPDKAISISERRELESKPKLSGETIADGSYMKKLENYLLDQFALRDDFRRIKAMAQFNLLRMKDNHNIYIKDGSAVFINYPLKEKSVTKAGEKLSLLTETYFKNMNVYYSIIPDKAYFASANGYPSINYQDLIALLKSNMNSGNYIDMFDTLKLSDYYNTDSHWKQENTINTINLILESMKAEAVNSKAFDIIEFSPFYGVYYGHSALPLNPDTIRCLTSESIKTAVVQRLNAQKKVFESGKIYDSELFKSNDPYDVFLGGASPVVKMTNGSDKNDRTIYLFSDSFGRSMAPLFLESYKEVVVVDVRYIRYTRLSDFIDFKENSDVLYLYGAETILNSETLNIQ